MDAQPQVSSPPPPPKQSGRSVPNDLAEVLSFIKTIIVFVGIALLIRVSVIEPFKIPSGSMIPTLRIDDYILVNKLSYGLHIPFVTDSVVEWSAPTRGDVVVFTRPDEPGTLEDESETNIIKRVIGLPGDTVEVRKMQVFINNEPLPEVYARWELGGIREGYFGPQQVPPGHVLLLGDNRDHSRDSRFWPYPFLDMRRIKGRAFVIYWSWHSLMRFGTIIR